MTIENSLKLLKSFNILKVALCLGIVGCINCSQSIDSMEQKSIYNINTNSIDIDKSNDNINTKFVNISESLNQFEQIMDKIRKKDSEFEATRIREADNMYKIPDIETLLNEASVYEDEIDNALQKQFEVIRNKNDEVSRLNSKLYKINNNINIINNCDDFIKALLDNSENLDTMSSEYNKKLKLLNNITKEYSTYNSSYEQLSKELKSLKIKYWNLKNSSNGMSKDDMKDIL